MLYFFNMLSSEQITTLNISKNKKNGRMILKQDVRTIKKMQMSNINLIINK